MCVFEIKRKPRFFSWFMERIQLKNVISLTFKLHLWTFSIRKKNLQLRKKRHISHKKTNPVNFNQKSFCILKNFYFVLCRGLRTSTKGKKRKRKNNFFN